MALVTKSLPTPDRNYYVLHLYYYYTVTYLKIIYVPARSLWIFPFEKWWNRESRRTVLVEIDYCEHDFSSQSQRVTLASSLFSDRYRVLEDDMRTIDGSHVLLWIAIEKPTLMIIHHNIIIEYIICTYRVPECIHVGLTQKIPSRSITGSLLLDNIEKTEWMLWYEVKWQPHHFVCYPITMAGCENSIPVAFFQQQHCSIRKLAC